MIGIDTNVLVRYIMQDDARQSAKATAFMESLTAERPGFVALVSVVELVWVLGSAYGLQRVQIAQSLEGLLRAREMVIDHADIVSNAARLFKSTAADFADCLIQMTAHDAGCEKVMTFDKGAAHSAGMTLIQ